MPKPEINVTPLIDVLLVLLIIFMIIAPIKPSKFETKLPQERKNADSAVTNPLVLIVAINSDKSLRLNNEKNLGTVENPEIIIEKLRDIFKKRTENQVYSDNLSANNQLSSEDKIEKTVFIKAPKQIDYGSVAKIVDAVKIAGANPISLQIDDL
ncbi:N/A [soil metagenome]